MVMYISTIVNNLFSQVQLEGLQKAADTSPLNGALVGFIIILLAGIVFLFKEYKGVQKDIKGAQKENLDKLDGIRKEMTIKEDTRNNQWLQSEKETLQVLNGVSSILEMSEKMGQNDTQKILERVKNVEEKLLQSIKELKKNNNTNEK